MRRRKIGKKGLLCGLLVSLTGHSLLSIYWATLATTKHRISFQNTDPDENVLTVFRGDGVGKQILQRPLESSGSARNRPVSPPPAPFDFSGCLLIRDDNKVLPEWIAYHYTVLPLRYLVVAVDPFSLTSPEPIFDLFKRKLPDLEVEVWNDTHYVDGWRRRGNVKRPVNDNANDYIRRQQIFLTMCMRHMNKRNKTWTVLVDTDEYVTYNPIRNPQNPRPEGGWASFKCKQEQERNGSQARFRCMASLTEEMKSGLNPRNRVPTSMAGANATIAHHIASENEYYSSGNIREAAYTQRSVYEEFACISLPRMLFGPKESEPSQIAAGVPPGLNVTSFNTLQYRHYEEFERWDPGKCLVDASRYTDHNYVVQSPHAVYRPKCNQWGWFPLVDAALRVQHYTGSLEVFTSLRRSEEKFVHRTNFTYGGEDDVARGWLESFVAIVGLESALELIEGSQEWAWKDDARAYSLKT